MIRDNKIWLANNDKGEPVFLLPSMANRHGLVAGATGTGKTVTLKVMAESFSAMGVPVFMADVKGDIAGMMKPGVDSENMQSRIAKFGLAQYGFQYEGSPVTLWDIYGQKGIQLRTTISEMGPTLLARVLGLNDLQSDILSVVFKIADDANLLLIDTKDLKSMLNFVGDHANEYAAEYGKISSASLGVITRAIVALESEGADVFFGEPALNIADWLTQDAGRGMINVLDSSSLINNGRLYSAFLLWMLSELFETLPEVGDLDKPKMVFFFDEAHLLFNDISKTLLDKIEQLVKLIRSKGVGVYFCTQNPRDIPDNVLAQLGNKVQHGLRAYTPAEQKAVKAAAESFRENPDFDTFETILALGTGEAVISTLDEKGIPNVAEKSSVLPPKCLMDTIDDMSRDNCIKSSLLYGKYANSVDPESAYELLLRRGVEEQEAKEAAAAEALRQKEAEKAAAEAEKQAAAEAKAAEKAALAEAKAQQKAEQDALKAAEKQILAEAKAKAAAEAKAEQEAQKAAEKAAKEAAKEEEQKAKDRQRLVKNAGSSVASTVGREVGQALGSAIGGSTGKKIGGNLGATLGRGLIGTLFKK